MMNAAESSPAPDGSAVYAIEEAIHALEIDRTAGGCALLGKACDVTLALTWLRRALAALKTPLLEGEDHEGGDQNDTN